MSDVLTILISVTEPWGDAPLPPALTGIFRTLHPEPDLLLRVLSPAPLREPLYWGLHDAINRTRTAPPAFRLQIFPPVAPATPAPLAHLEAWQVGLAGLALGTQFLALSGDHLVLTPLAACWAVARPPGFTWAMPRGRYWHPSLLAGVVRVGSLGFLTEWHREATRLGALPEPTRLGLLHQYGSVLGAAWALIVSRNEEGGGPIVATLPADWGAVA